MDTEQIKHPLDIEDNDWTVVEETGTDLRTEFEPSTYKSATRNSGRRRFHKARLTKSASRWISTLSLIDKNNTKGTDHYLTPLKKYESLVDAYEGAVQPKTSQKTPTKKRVDPKTEAEKYIIANKARN